MNIHILLMILFLKESDANWKLVWNDEFNNQILDTEKWEIENESNKCHGEYVGHNNCNTNSSKNLRLVNGSLAITAIYQKHLNKDYTSAKITSQQSFTYGRFEIRAALPEGKLLKSSIYMIPITYAEWAINGLVNIMTNKQTSRIGSGLHYNKPAIYENHEMGGFLTNTSLNNFHIYALEWNEYEFKWFFDDFNYFTINISRVLGSAYTRNSEPFDKPFKLVIHLGVGGDLFPDEKLTLEDVINWKCSLLIIDYVRIYKRINGTEKLSSKEDQVFTDQICSTVMPLIRPEKEVYTIPTFILAIILLLIFTLVMLITMILFIRQKKLKQQNVKNNIENYDDVCDPDRYSVLNAREEYAEYYQELRENNVENDYKTGRVDKQNQKEKTISEGRYLRMDKKV